MTPPGPCPFGVITCWCQSCEKQCNKGWNCKECEYEGRAMHNVYLCTGFEGTYPWEKKHEV